MFGRKKMQKEIDDLRDRIRVIETFTVPAVSTHAQKLRSMNGPTGDGVFERICRLEESVRNLRPWLSWEETL